MVSKNFRNTSDRRCQIAHKSRDSRDPQPYAKSRGCGGLRPWSPRASCDFEVNPKNRLRLAIFFRPAKQKTLQFYNSLENAIRTNKLQGGKIVPGVIWDLAMRYMTREILPRSLYFMPLILARITPAKNEFTWSEICSKSSFLSCNGLHHCGPPSLAEDSNPAPAPKIKKSLPESLRGVRAEPPKRIKNESSRDSESQKSGSAGTPRRLSWRLFFEVLSRGGFWLLCQAGRIAITRLEKLFWEFIW